MTGLLLTSNTNSYTNRRILEEAEALGIDMFVNRLPTNEPISFVINRAMRPLPKLLSKRVPVQYNAATDTSYVIRTYQRESLDVTLPKVPGMLYNNETYPEIVNALGAPFIVKQAFSNSGSGVTLVNGKRDFKKLKNISTCERFMTTQKNYCKVKVLVIRGEIAAAVKYNSNDWKFNKAEPTNLEHVPFEITKCVRKIYSDTKMKVFTVDLLVTNGEFYFLDIACSINLGLFEKVTKENLTKVLFKAICEDVKRTNGEKLTGPATYDTYKYQYSTADILMRMS